MKGHLSRTCSQCSIYSVLMFTVCCLPYSQSQWQKDEHSCPSVLSFPVAPRGFPAQPRFQRIQTSQGNWTVLLLNLIEFCWVVTAWADLSPSYPNPGLMATFLLIYKLPSYHNTQWMFDFLYICGCTETRAVTHRSSYVPNVVFFWPYLLLHYHFLQSEALYGFLLLKYIKYMTFSVLILFTLRQTEICSVTYRLIIG